MDPTLAMQHLMVDIYLNKQAAKTMPSVEVHMAAGTHLQERVAVGIGRQVLEPRKDRARHLGSKVQVDKRLLLTAHGDGAVHERRRQEAAPRKAPSLTALRFALHCHVLLVDHAVLWLDALIAQQCNCGCVLTRCHVRARVGVLHAWRLCVSSCGSARMCCISCCVPVLSCCHLL